MAQRLVEVGGVGRLGEDKMERVRHQKALPRSQGVSSLSVRIGHVRKSHVAKQMSVMEQKKWQERCKDLKLHDHGML